MFLESQSTKKLKLCICMQIGLPNTAAARMMRFVRDHATVDRCSSQSESDVVVSGDR